MRIVELSACVLAVTLAGCRFGPTTQQLKALESLNIGTTTKDEARKLLGKPWRSAEGAWHVDVYQLGKWQVDTEGFNPRHLMNHGDAVDLTTLHLLFNSTSILERTNIHRWAATAKVKGFLLNRIGPEFSTQDQERIRAGVTKLSDLEEWFGPPVIIGPNERGETTATWYSTLHAYGGLVDGFEHQNLTATLNPDGTVSAFALRGKLKPPKTK